MDDWLDISDLLERVQEFLENNEISKAKADILAPCKAKVIRIGNSESEDLITIE